jgi:threonine dehydratase
LTSLSVLSDAYQMLSLLDAVRPTTFIQSSKLRHHLGLDVTIASETFQHTGSFKFRAAYNVAVNVPNDSILTASSGNFGQAIAYACKLTGKKCTVVMPQTSAQVKIDAVRAFDATVDLIDVEQVGRAERVTQLAETMPDAYIASPYDDELVIEGNSTLGDELAGKDFDAVIVPVGGGGLISGMITGLRRHGENAEVVGAEPRLGNDGARSFRAGELISNESEPKTIADGARTISLGKLNWPIIRDGAKDFIEVSDDNIAKALKLYFELANLKCEPTGALSLGAIVEDPARFKGKSVCVIVSGGNVDPGIYRELI